MRLIFKMLLNLMTIKEIMIFKALIIFVINLSSKVCQVLRSLRKVKKNLYLILKHGKNFSIFKIYHIIIFNIITKLYPIIKI
jgi:hypothetical protein